MEDRQHQTNPGRIDPDGQNESSWKSLLGDCMKWFSLVLLLASCDQRCGKVSESVCFPTNDGATCRALLSNAEEITIERFVIQGDTVCLVADPLGSSWWVRR